ncbi:efflux RND transporter periplasmic adaptor subunit [Aeromonas veronii]|uniref:efflux RND transporter periplasmic adaptor subunit n=1 Tax=Aeromonas veronii TaxID=654 RepID=UPI0031FDBAAB
MILCLILLALLLSGCSPVTESEETPALTRVIAQPLQASDHYPVLHRFNGRVIAPEHSQIGFELAGRIATLHKGRGEPVAAGELLATLDTRLLAVEAKELAARAAQSEAELTLARQTLDRLTALRQQQFSSRQALDEQQGKVRMLEASANQLAAALEANRVKQEKSQLRAPFNGIVVSREQALGAVVAAGQPLFSLTRSGQWEADIGVPVKQAETLIVGQHYPLQSGAQSLEGRLLNLGVQVDGQTHTRTARFQLIRGGEQLAEGQLITLLHQTREPTRAYEVPLTALTQGLRGSWTLYLLNDETPPRVVSRDVTLLQQDGERAWISGALNGQEQLVTDGLHKLVPGQQVTLTTSVDHQAAHPEPQS